MGKDGQQHAGKKYGFKAGGRGVIYEKVMTRNDNGDMVSRKTTYEVGDPEGDKDNG